MELGSAGALALIDLLAFCDVPPLVARVIGDASPRPTPDQLRSSVPVFDATPQQRAALRALHGRQRALRHPNLPAPFNYSFAVEGGAVLV
jgi:hypothetical protein